MNLPIILFAKHIKRQTFMSNEKYRTCKTIPKVVSSKYGAISSKKTEPGLIIRIIAMPDFSMQSTYYFVNSYIPDSVGVWGERGKKVCFFSFLKFQKLSMQFSAKVSRTQVIYVKLLTKMIVSIIWLK